MSIRYLKNGLAVGSAKEAALYFDMVVPLDLIAGATERENAQSIMVQRKPERIVKSLLPGVDDPMSFYRGHAGIAQAFWDLVGLRQIHQDTGSCAAFFDLDQAYVTEAWRIVKMVFDEDIDSIAHDIETGHHDFDEYRQRCNRMLDDGLQSIGFSVFSTWHDPFYGTSVVDAPSGTTLSEGSVSVVLQGLDLIDADKLPWKKILAIRKDQKALTELRDLRLFLHETMVGLEYDAAVDKIQSCLDRYRQQVGAWSLETVKKSLSMVVSKEGVGLTALGALASFALTGIPVDPVTLAAMVAAAVKSGAVLNLGGTAAIQFMEARVEKKKLDASPESSIRYLQRLRKA
jgi:hypothetical protein